MNQVEEGEATTEVALGDRDDEAQVGLDHVHLGPHVAALDPLGQGNLLVGTEKRNASDLAQEEAKRVERGLDREIELGRPRLLLRDQRLLVRKMRTGLARGEIDAVIDQIGVEIFGLLLGDFRVLERRGDLVVAEESFLQTLLRQSLELFDIREGDLDSEH